MTAPSGAPVQITDLIDPHVILAIICVVVAVMIVFLLLARLSDEKRAARDKRKL